PRLHVRIVAFAIAPARFLAVDDRPAQAAHLVVLVERREVVPVAATERGVFLEQSFLHVEAERLRFLVVVARRSLSQWKAVNIAVAIKHVEQSLASIVRIGGKKLRGPDLISSEALGELH